METHTCAGAPAPAPLRTDRLLLVPLAEAHLPHEVELDSDPEVMRHLTGRASTREETERRHRERLATARVAPGLGYRAGFEGDRFVGLWILGPSQPSGRDPVDGEAELGYRLLRRHWGRGLASEGAHELLRHAFDDLGLHRVYAETMAVNTASRATMAAVGLRHVRTFHLDWDHPLEGSELGEVEYAVTAAGWAGRGTTGTTG